MIRGVSSRRMSCNTLRKSFVKHFSALDPVLVPVLLDDEAGYRFRFTMSLKQTPCRIARFVSDSLDVVSSEHLKDERRASACTLPCGGQTGPRTRTGSC